MRIRLKLDVSTTKPLPFRHRLSLDSHLALQQVLQHITYRDRQFNGETLAFAEARYDTTSFHTPA